MSRKTLPIANDAPQHPAKQRSAPQMEPQESMRARIKSTATDLFIRHGYRGVSFGDISAELEITRANIHYHFGNKQKLLDEVLEDYVDGTLARLRWIWSSSAQSFSEKLEGTIAFNRERYVKFNRGRSFGRPWSLIARMRSDSDVIGDYSRRTLQRFARELSAYIESAVVAAIGRGELKRDTPVADVIVQAVSIVNAAGPLTQDAGNFERLDELYRAFLRTTQEAYGARAKADSSAGTRAASRRSIKELQGGRP